MVSRRSGQISHSLRTDLSLGAPIRWLTIIQFTWGKMPAISYLFIWWLIKLIILLWVVRCSTASRTHRIEDVIQVLWKSIYLNAFFCAMCMLPGRRGLGFSRRKDWFVRPQVLPWVDLILVSYSCTSFLNTFSLENLGIMLMQFLFSTW